MRIGPVELSAVKDWDPAPGVLVSWHPTPASCAKALAAPVSAVPPSYVQARQIRSFSEQAARGLDHSRLLIASVEVFGHCDLRAMTYVINAHLRRHDTYRSWFELRDTDHIVRHSIADPADIEFVPTTWRDDERGPATAHRGDTGFASLGLLQLRSHSASRLLHVLCQHRSSACGRSVRRSRTHGVPVDVHRADNG